MKASLRIASLVLVLLSLFAPVASAHYLGYRWPTCSTTVPFIVPFNDTWRIPIQGAMNSWNAVNTCNPLSIAGSGTNNDMNAVTDQNRNDVAWMTPTWTLKFLGPNELTQTDITFNLKYTFSDSPAYNPGSGVWDIESLAAHELGHAIGLAHNDDTPTCSDTDITTWASCATMGKNWGSGIIHPRSLETHDQADKRGRY